MYKRQDVGVASEVALSGVRGAAMNVLINLQGLGNSAYCKKKEKNVRDLIKKAETLHNDIFKKTLNTIIK